MTNQKVVLIAFDDLEYETASLISKGWTIKSIDMEPSARPSNTNWDSRACVLLERAIGDEPNRTSKRKKSLGLEDPNLGQENIDDLSDSILSFADEVSDDNDYSKITAENAVDIRGNQRAIEKSNPWEKYGEGAEIKDDYKPQSDADYRKITDAMNRKEILAKKLQDAEDWASSNDDLYADL